MIDTHGEKLCCPKCHHLINVKEQAPLENCPYCKKKLPQDNIEFWRHIAKSREIKKRRYDMAQTFCIDSATYHWWKASSDNTKQMKPLTFEMMQKMFDLLEASCPEPNAVIVNIGEPEEEEDG